MIHGILPETEAGLEEDTEAAYFEDIRALALPILAEHWLNDKDAVYDTLLEAVE